MNSLLRPGDSELSSLFYFFISMTSSAYLISHLLFGSVLVSVLDTSQASDVLVAAGIGKIQW